jgi:hypothetical protein
MLASTALVVSLPASVQTTGPWSTPARLAACSAPGAPEIVFPSDEPRHGTGPGAIAWTSGGGCAGPAAPRVAAIAPSDDVPGPAIAPRTPTGSPLRLAGPLAAAAAGAHGRILLAGAEPVGGRAPSGPGPRTSQDGRTDRSGRTDPPPQPGGLFSEGQAGGPFASPQATGGPATPMAVATAYLGDVAIASPGAPGRAAGPAGAIELRMHRHYTSAFQPPVPVTDERGVEGLALAMDYRSDALVAWERGGVIWARFMPGSDRIAYPSRRVATAAPGAQIAAVLSDDNRAILAFSETKSGVTSVYAELSSPMVRFGQPRLLERFADPGGDRAPSGPRLVRLASESVMLAWTGAASGRWTVRTAAVDLNGVRPASTISAPGHDAILADLAPGPAGEAIALWSEPQTSSAGGSTSGPAGGRPDGRAAGGPAAGPLGYGDRALYGARGIDAYPGRTIFGAPQLIAAPGTDGTTGQASVGIDPDSDRALVAWRTPAGAIDYSLHALGSR